MMIFSMKMVFLASLEKLIMWWNVELAFWSLTADSSSWLSLERGAFLCSVSMFHLDYLCPLTLGITAWVLEVKQVYNCGLEGDWEWGGEGMRRSLRWVCQSTAGPELFQMVPWLKVKGEDGAQQRSSLTLFSAWGPWMSAPRKWGVVKPQSRVPGHQRALGEKREQWSKSTGSQRTQWGGRCQDKQRDGGRSKDSGGVMWWGGWKVTCCIQSHWQMGDVGRALQRYVSQDGCELHDWCTKSVAAQEMFYFF